MANKINTREIYEMLYKEYVECIDPDASKYAWVANEVFDLITYDTSLDERFAKEIIEVIKVILDVETYEYIRDGSNYVAYILVCQLLNNFHWIEWGTSIRGAWFETYHPGFKTQPITIYYDDNIRDYVEVMCTKENMEELINFVES